MRIVSLILAWMALPLTLAAQVGLNPTALTIHGSQPIGQLTITNSSNEPMEVSISSEFGYPEVGPDGTLQMNYSDAEAAGLYGLDSHMRLFPRQFILQAGERQIVRVQILPMADRPAGLYWTRIKVASNEVTRDQAELAAAGFSSRVSYRIQQNIGVFYRHGDVSTGLRVDAMRTEDLGDTLRVTTRMSRTGNSPYMGHMRFRLLTPAGVEALTYERPFSVYFDRNWPISIPVQGIAPGSYTLEFIADTQRADIPPSDIVTADTYRQSIPVRLD